MKSPVLAAALLAIPAMGIAGSPLAIADPPATPIPATDDRAKEEGTAEAAVTPPADPAETGDSREERFASYMTGAKLVGRFTIIGGAEDKMPEEEYTISKCEKLPEENLYRFTARIRYGETDVELPMDLPVEWAGDTPVITLTNLWIPGLGTFSARVLIYRDRYSGTWTHGEVGGHLFGVIKKEA